MRQAKVLARRDRPANLAGRMRQARFALDGIVPLPSLDEWLLLEQFATPPPDTVSVRIGSQKTVSQTVENLFAAYWNPTSYRCQGTENKQTLAHGQISWHM